MATYLEVAKYCGYDGENRDDAKQFCISFANKEGMKVSELFDEVEEANRMSNLGDLSWEHEVYRPRGFKKY